MPVQPYMEQKTPNKDKPQIFMHIIARVAVSHEQKKQHDHERIKQGFGGTYFHFDSSRYMLRGGSHRAKVLFQNFLKMFAWHDRFCKTVPSTFAGSRSWFMNEDTMFAKICLILAWKVRDKRMRLPSTIWQPVELSGIRTDSCSSGWCVCPCVRLGRGPLFGTAENPYELIIMYLKPHAVSLLANMILSSVVEKLRRVPRENFLWGMRE